MPYPWFRLWVELLDDPKVRHRPGDEQWCLVAVFALASGSPVRGVLLAPDGEPLTAEHVADKAGKSLKAARSALAYFARDGIDIIAKTDDGAWLVNNWDKRQPASDDVTSRTRLHRERKAAGNVPGNVAAHVPGNGDRNGSPSVDLDLEDSASFDDDFAALYALLPHRRPGESRDEGLRCYSARRAEGIPADELKRAALAYYSHIDRLANGRFTLSTATFFGDGRRWKDFLQPGALADTNVVGLTTAAKSQRVALEDLPA